MIPRRIIQTGPSCLPVVLKAGKANARLLHPCFEYQFFDDTMVEDFMRDQPAECRKAFDSCQYRIQKYDIFRYLVVYRFGGFYLDLDVLLADELDPLLSHGCVFAFEELTDSDYFWKLYEMDWQIGNYAFGAEAAHPFLGAIIENCLRASQDPSWVAPMMKWAPKPLRGEIYILNSTGPGLVSRTYAENTALAASVEILFPEDVRDPRTWHCFGSFGVHHMAGSWREAPPYLWLRFMRVWEGWKLRRLAVRSESRGKTRSRPRGGHGQSDCATNTFRYGLETPAEIIENSKK